MWAYVVASDSSFSVFDLAEFWALFSRGGESITTEGMLPSLRSLVAKVQRKVSTDLYGVEKISATVDGWTSKAGNGHTTLTLHWIDSEFTMQNAVLGAPPLEESATAAYLKTVLSKRMADFGVSLDSIIAICADRGANYQATLRRELRLPTMDCICHLLDGAMKQVSEVYFAPTIAWAQTLVLHFKRSPASKKLLRSMQQQRASPTLGLKSASQTRWAFFVPMFQRILDVWEDMEAMATSGNFAHNKIRRLWRNIGEDDHEDDNNTPKRSDMKAIVAVMDMVRLRIEVLQGTCCIGQVLPTLLCLYSSMKNPIDEDVPRLQKELYRAIREKLSQRFAWADLPGAWYRGMILDPRFKRFNPTAMDLPTPLDRQWPKIIRAQEKELLKELKFPTLASPTSPATLDEEEENRNDCDLPEGHHALPIPEDEALFSTPTKKRMTSELARMLYGQTLPSLSPQQETPPLEQQLNSYLAAPPIDVTHDPLSWWKSNANRFPDVARLARAYLAIQVSAAASERVWSIAGNQVTKKRYSMSPATLDDLVFLKCNLARRTDESGPEIRQEM